MTREDPPRPDPQEGWFEGRAFVRPVRIYYEDTDFSGVVYHANHLRYFERGRSDFFRAAGVSHTDLAGRTPPIVFTVRRIDVEYLTPARIDDALLVRTTFDALRGARLLAEQRLERGAALVAQAAVEAACMGLDGRPRRLPSDLVEKLSPYLPGAPGVGEG